MRAFDDRSAVALAIAAAIGAAIAFPGVALIGGLTVTIAWALRRPRVMIVGVALLTSGLAARATAGLVVEPGAWSGMVTVIGVGTTADGETHAEVRGANHHFDLRVPRGSQRLVAAAQPGDRLVVSGRVHPLDPARSRRRGSHVAARLTATHVSRGSGPRWWWRTAGGVRRSVHGLGRPLPDSQRALFDGFVLGDASRQSELQRADFRSSGLTHLLVASGENIAFVLMLAAPLTSRIGLRSRWVVTVGACAMYALVTGLEPSVLRAATMAVVAATAIGVGRPVRPWRSLAYAATALMVLDPFLVHSMAFGLSVGASAGIIALAHPLGDVIGGPAWFGRPLGVTIAAQIGVTPFLLGLPGGMPIASIPANLLAAVPAGLVMVAGIPALLVVATGLPGSAVLLWVPEVLLGWVDLVARRTAALPLGDFGLWAVVVASVGVVVSIVATRRGRVTFRRIGLAVALAGVAAPAAFGVGSGTRGPAGGGPYVVRDSGSVAVVLT
ncbi:MAG: ComEC/Rec2 family competence protein, partial [Actinobacteria bacterium]|nr:ComEC/Rec2 family competence protein [Actinomycetota bacterium]